MSLSKYNTTTKELEPIAGGFDVQGILDDIGDLTELETTDKSDLVDAINEVNSGKVDKVEGKGLSTNDYDDTEKGKVADNTAATEATQDMISDAYNSSSTYNVGDYCIYNNVLYKCNTAIATPEAFTPAKWTVTKVASEIKPIYDKYTIITVASTITIPANSMTAIATTSKQVLAAQFKGYDDPNLNVCILFANQWYGDFRIMCYNAADYQITISEGTKVYVEYY